jgi:hypothetical protein
MATGWQAGLGIWKVYLYRAPSWEEIAAAEAQDHHDSIRIATE